MAVSFIGASDSNVAPIVSAADAMTGLLCLLSWAAAGVNLLPDSVDISGFWKGTGSLEDAPNPQGFLQMSALEWTGLLRDVGRAAGYSLKGLSPGSMKPYTSSIRNGYRPNDSAACPAVPTSYHVRSQTLMIRPLAFDPRDLAQIPAWVSSLIRGA